VWAVQYAVPDVQAHQQFILASVLQGTSTRGTPQDLEPPKDPSTGLRFDTTADAHDSIIVTYRDPQGLCASVCVCVCVCMRLCD